MHLLIKTGVPCKVNPDPHLLILDLKPTLIPNPWPTTPKLGQIIFVQYRLVNKPFINLIYIINIVLYFFVTQTKNHFLQMGQKSIWLTLNHIIGYIGQDNYANFFIIITTSNCSYPREIDVNRTRNIGNLPKSSHRDNCIPKSSRYWGECGFRCSLFGIKHDRRKNNNRHRYWKK